MGADTLNFTLAHHEFEKLPEKSRRLQLYALALSKQGDLLERCSLSENSKSRYFDYDGKLRDSHKPINMDEGITLDLGVLRDDVTTVLLGIRLPDVASLAKPENQATLKYSSYGLEYQKYALQIDKKPLASVKLDELVQAPENPDEPNQPSQAAFVLCYVISFRPEFGGWYLQTLNSTVKGKT